MIYFYLVMAVFAVSDAINLKKSGGKSDVVVYLLLTAAAALGAFMYYTNPNAPSFTRLLFA